MLLIRKHCCFHRDGPMNCWRVCRLPTILNDILQHKPQALFPGFSFLRYKNSSYRIQRISNRRSCDWHCAGYFPNHRITKFDASRSNRYSMGSSSKPNFRSCMFLTLRNRKRRSVNCSVFHWNHNLPVALKSDFVISGSNPLHLWWSGWILR